MAPDRPVACKILVSALNLKVKNSPASRLRLIRGDLGRAIPRLDQLADTEVAR